VPSEMRLSIGDRGRDVIVAGLSPVNGVIMQSELDYSVGSYFSRSYILT